MTIPRACLAVMVLVCGAARLSAAAERPNVVLLMADDLGWGDLRCFEASSPIHTPHLDAMAADGLKFTRFYAQAPVCSPTRGSCLTGRHPYRYGIHFANDGHLPAEEITLPELLKQQGYATGHFGKWHLGTLTTEIEDANRGGPRGKDHFAPPQLHGYGVCFATESKVPTYDPLLKPRGAGENAWDAMTDRSAAVPYGTRYWDQQGRIAEDNLLGDDSRVIMDRALPFIETAVRRKQPFFATIWFHAPHLPVVAAPEHAARYASCGVYERNYYGCISAMDEQIGRLRRRLRECGAAENTMLWFCSDNGPEGRAGKAPGSAGPFRGRKRSLYEGGVRVPGIVVWPGRVRPGSATDVPAVTSDYLPTVVDALDLDYPEDRPLDGISLLPLFDGRMSQRGRPIGFQSQKQRSLVTDRYKLYRPDISSEWELYDLAEDAGETQNLAGQHPQLVEELARQLEEWTVSCQRSAQGNDF